MQHKIHSLFVTKSIGYSSEFVPNKIVVDGQQQNLKLKRYCTPDTDKVAGKTKHFSYGLPSFRVKCHSSLMQQFFGGDGGRMNTVLVMFGQLVAMSYPLWTRLDRSAPLPTGF